MLKKYYFMKIYFKNHNHLIINIKALKKDFIFEKNDMILD